MIDLKTLNKFRKKNFRDSYVSGRVSASIASQIRENREQRNLSQAELAKVVGTSQSVIARFESSDYGKISVTSLTKIAQALDVALVVRLTSFDDFLSQHGDVTPQALRAEPFEKTLARWEHYEGSSSWSPGLVSQAAGNERERTSTGLRDVWFEEDQPQVEERSAARHYIGGNTA